MKKVLVILFLIALTIPSYTFAKDTQASNSGRSEPRTVRIGKDTPEIQKTLSTSEAQTTDDKTKKFDANAFKTKFESERAQMQLKKSSEGAGLRTVSTKITELQKKVERIKSLETEVEQAHMKNASLSAERKEELQKQLTKVKDEKKKETVTNIDTKLQEINTKRTSKMSEILTKLNAIVEKLTAKVATLEAEGKDVTILTTALTNAQTAITESSTLVSQQAAKTYSIQVTDEFTLKNTVGKTMSQLQSDLQTVNASLIVSKQAVQKVISLLSSTSATPSPSISPAATPSAVVIQP